MQRCTRSILGDSRGYPSPLAYRVSGSLSRPTRYQPNYCSGLLKVGRSSLQRCTRSNCPLRE
eukprot:12915210-Prorocentrum_lima.AAC.1